MNKPKIFILIPAYNEQGKIKSVISELLSAGYSNVLVIDDGSKDKTAEYAKEGGAEVLKHIINRGQGAALSTGLTYLKEKYSPDIIITFDADGQHRTEDIPKLIKPILDNNVDIVLGSRFLGNKNNKNVPFIRRMILKAGIFFTRIISDIKLTDTHNGFRALGKKAIESIEINQRKMEHASEIIDEIKKKNLSFTEVPVEIIYTNYSKAKGQRTSNFIKIGLKMIIKKITE